MSIRWMSEIWEYGPDETTRRFVLLALADNADDNGDCFPSIVMIARKCCLKERMVQYHLKALESDGYLQVERGGHGRGNRSRYRLLRVWVQPIAPLKVPRVQPTAPLDPPDRVQPTAPLEGDLRVQFSTAKGAIFDKNFGPFNAFNHQVTTNLKNSPPYPPSPPIAEVVVPPSCEGERKPGVVLMLPSDQTANREITDLATLVVLASPWARSRSWTAFDVKDAHRRAAIDAAKSDALLVGMSIGDALSELLRTVERHQPDNAQYAGNIQTYFANRNYRPNAMGESNGTSERRGFQRHPQTKAERTLDSLAEVRARRAARRELARSNGDL